MEASNIGLHKGVEMKYYYDDQLQAGWMSREFNIKMHGNSTYEQYEPSDRWIVHPDSYEILKPQVSDLVSGTLLTKFVNFDDYAFKVSEVTSYGKGVSNLKCPLGKRKRMLTKSLRIIQRQGKAFFTPLEMD